MVQPDVVSWHSPERSLKVITGAHRHAENYVFKIVQVQKLKGCTHISVNQSHQNKIWMESRWRRCQHRRWLAVGSSGRREGINRFAPCSIHKLAMEQVVAGSIGLMILHFYTMRWAAFGSFGSGSWFKSKLSRWNQFYLLLHPTAQVVAKSQKSWN